ncbi:MAG: TonB-dependent receptor [Myxococcales bacterium]|nr:TonB-dependent receptor [Myxococcales bacterium]
MLLLAWWLTVVGSAQVQHTAKPSLVRQQERACLRVVEQHHKEKLPRTWKTLRWFCWLPKRSIGPSSSERWRHCTLRCASSFSSQASSRPVSRRTSPQDEVVVHARRMRDKIETEEPTGFVQLLGRKGALQSARTLGEVLRESAGVQIRSLGSWGALTQASIRGSTPGQVQVFLDGVPLNLGSVGGVDLGDLPLGGLERVEVYRGFVPATLGGAMGGAIHLVTREGGKALRWGLGATTGSFASAKFQANYQQGHGDWRWGAYANLLRSGGAFSYYDDRGTPLNVGDDLVSALRQNNDTQLAQGILRLGWRKKGLRLDASHLSAWREQGIPGLGQFRSNQARFETSRHVGQLRFQARQVPWKTTRLDVQLQWLQQHERFSDPLGEVGIGRRQIETDRQGLGGTTLLEWWISPLHRLQWPLWVRWEQSSSQDRLQSNTRPLQAQRTHGWSALVYQGQVPDEWVSWQASIRAEGVFSRTSQSATSFDEVLRWYPTGRLGLQVWPWRPLRIKANVGRYVRVPDFSELFGDRGATLGNPNLRPEQGWQWDVGAQWRIQRKDGILRRLEIEAVFFGSAAQDLIRWLQNSQRTLIAANIDQALTLGMEARLLLELAGWFRLEGAWTFLDARNLSAAAFEQGRQLPGRPRYDLFLQATLKRPWGRLFYRYHFLGENWLDRANLVVLGSRHLHSVGLVLYPIRLARLFGHSLPWEGMRIQLEVNNLFDTRMTWVPLQPPLPNLEQIPQSIADIGGYPLPGRAFYLSVHWDF